MTAFIQRELYIQRTLMHERRETENGEKNKCIHACRENLYAENIKHARRKNIVFANLECL